MFGQIFDSVFNSMLASKNNTVSLGQQVQLNVLNETAKINAMINSKINNDANMMLAIEKLGISFAHKGGEIMASSAQ